MVLKKRLFLAGAAFALALLFVVGACKTASHSTETAGNAHWGYEGENGPAFWHTLDPAFALARDGKEQSPIDIATERLQGGYFSQKPSFHYAETRFELENNGHTIELKVKDGADLLDLDGETYSLTQFHFHAPSEHRIDGKAFPMEAHFVYQNGSGGLAVVGYFIEEGAENPFIREAFAELPADHSSRELETPLDLANFLPQGGAFYRYDGSLTTPPCTEGVKWVLSDQPIAFSGEQIARFKSLYEGNNRPVQDLHARSVYRVQ